MPELHDDKEWAKQKKIVDDHNVRGERLSYWDHLSTDEWVPMFDAEFKEQAYVTEFNHVYEAYLERIRVFICSVYPPNVRDNQMCALLIYWHLVTSLEAAFFLMRWLLPWGRMEWNNIKQTLGFTSLLQPYAEHRNPDRTINCEQLEIPNLDFDQDFPIITSEGEGQDIEINYNPQVHGDLLLYPEAFVPVPEMKVQALIHQMEPDQVRNWNQYYLFQELLGEIADIRGLRRDLSDEDSDSRTTAMSSRQTPTGSQHDLAASTSGVLASASGLTDTSGEE